jgi:hypothetical protein
LNSNSFEFKWNCLNSLSVGEKKKRRRRGEENSSPAALVQPKSLPLFPPLSSLFPRVGHDPGPVSPQPGHPTRHSSLPLSDRQAPPVSALFSPSSFLPGAQPPPRNRRRAALLGPARQGSLAALQRGSPEPRVLTLALRRPEDPQLRRPLLRRPSLSASPSGRCSRAPPTPTTPALASPHHRETSRAWHSNPEPLHHRNFITKPPPVSRSAVPIRRHRCPPSHADLPVPFAGTSRSDSHHPEGPATPASSPSAGARPAGRRRRPSSVARRPPYSPGELRSITLVLFASDAVALSRP